MRLGELGENIGTGVVDAMSGYLADNLSDRLTDSLTDTIADQGLLSAAGSLGASLGAGIAIAVSAAVTAIPIIDLINRGINPPEANTPQEIDEFTRRQIFQPGHPLHPDTPDPNRATREGGAGQILPVSAQLSEFNANRRRRVPGGLLGFSGFNIPQALSRQETAQRTAEATGTDRPFTEDIAREMYDSVFGEGTYDAEVAAATGTIAEIPEGIVGVATEAVEQAVEPLERFSLTGADRAVLAPYETAVTRAEQAVEDLTADSTPQEIADAYEALVFAQTNLSTITEGIIRAAADAGRITGTAATNAIMDLGLDLGTDLKTANTDLIRSLGAIGFEVVGGIENIREAIDVSDISSVFRRIPEEIESIEAPEQEVQAPPELRDRHRFTGAQRGILAPLETEVSDAEEFIRDFITEDSTPEEIQAAYTRLTDAETALYNQQLAFISSATDITEAAREDAMQAAGDDFDAEIRDANQRLTRALGGIGFELVNTLTFTSGILEGAALAVQQIPQELAAAAGTEAEIDPDDPLAPLRAGVAGARTGVGRARLNLSQSTSEQQFETRRLELITAINAEYAAQILLIGNLGLTEAEVATRSAAALLTRDRALDGATTATNMFAQARIRGEEDVVGAARSAAREQMRIAERQQREQDRALQQQIREEMRLHDEIDDLREDALDTEQDRQQAITDLYQDEARRREGIEEDHQDRLEDIRRRATQSREDVNREFERDIEDTLRAAGADESLFRSGDFQRLVSAASSTGDQGFLRSELERLGLNLSDEDLSGIRELAVERQRDTQDLDVRTGRAQVAAAERQTDALEALARQTEQRESDIQTAFAESSTALVTSQGELAVELRNLTTTLIGAPLDETISTPLMTAVDALDGTIGNLDGTVGGLREPIQELPDALEGLGQMAEQGSAAIEVRLRELLDFTPQELTQSELFQRVSGFTQGGGIAGLRNTYASPQDAFEALQTGIRALDAQFARDAEIERRFGVITEDRARRQEQLQNERLNEAFNISEALSAGGGFRQTDRLMQTATPTEFFADAVSIFARTVTVSGENVEGGGGNGGDRTTVVENNITLEMDTQKVGQAVGDTVVRQGQQGRSLLER